MKLIGILMTALVVGGSGVGAQEGDKSALPLDRAFLIKVATANNVEIQIGKLADTRSSSAGVKDYATTLIKDHEAAGGQLAELLKGRKLAIVAGFDKETKEQIKRLSKMEGTEFDKAFLLSMVKAHREAIALFENEAKNGQDQDIRSFAKDVLPTLRKHLDTATDLSKTIYK